MKEKGEIMPRGKMPVRGYISSMVNFPKELSFEVWLEIIMKHKKRGFQHDFSDSELHKFYIEIVTSISMYKGSDISQQSARNRVIMTSTEFKKEFSKIQNAARKVLCAKTDASLKIWMDKLDEYTRTDVWSLTVKDFFHRRLNKFSYSASDIQKFFNKKNVTLDNKKNLDEILKIISLDEAGWKKRIEKCFLLKDEQQIVLDATALPNGNGFVDPFLVEVIKQTSKSWVELTGRTLSYTPKTGIFCDQKQHLFAEYLDTLFSYFCLDKLPNGRVNDIIVRIF